jgi:hypothetical protein
VLSALSKAIVLYGAFEDMQGRPVNLMGSFARTWRRFLPVIVVAMYMAFLVGLAGVLVVIGVLSYNPILVRLARPLQFIPDLILSTMWFVAIPACVVERLGPWKSLRRSAALTKGNRWKAFGMVVVLTIISVIIDDVLTGSLAAAAGDSLGLLANLIWNALVGSFSATLGVVTYHDLRVAKEGVDTDQIAAVFE